MGNKTLIALAVTTIMLAFLSMILDPVPQTKESIYERMEHMEIYHQERTEQLKEG